MTDDEHPTTKSDSKPFKQPYEEPKKENLSGSYTDEEVTIIGNDPRARSPTDLIQNDTLKGKMRDLSVDPEADSPVAIQRAIRKREQRLHRQMLIDNEYNKRFSMFRTKGTTVAWLTLSVVLFVGIVYILGVVLGSGNSITAIPI